MPHCRLAVGTQKKGGLQMKKKVLLIIGYVLLLCIAVGLCMYAIPYNININTSMQATKMDKDGKIIGPTMLE